VGSSSSSSGSGSGTSSRSGTTTSSSSSSSSSGGGSSSSGHPHLAVRLAGRPQVRDDRLERRHRRAGARERVQNVLAPDLVHEHHGVRHRVHVVVVRHAARRRRRRRRQAQAERGVVQVEVPHPRPRGGRRPPQGRGRRLAAAVAAEARPGGRARREVVALERLDLEQGVGDFEELLVLFLPRRDLVQGQESQPRVGRARHLTRHRHRQHAVDVLEVAGAVLPRVPHAVQRVRRPVRVRPAQDQQRQQRQRRRRARAAAGAAQHELLVPDVLVHAQHGE